MIHRWSSLLENTVRYGRMIKFSHTVFALPFALAAAALAGRDHDIAWRDLFWIFPAMIGARSAAMGFNRIADARIDAANPRTKDREIPAGTISIAAAAGFVALSSALFMFAAAMLSSVCLYFSAPVLLLLFGYSFTKRFTWLAHLYLGFVISLAPLGTWLALTKTFDWPILLLSGALMTYIAGFDILYACQDFEFDANAGLHSIPARFGVPTALKLAVLAHCCSFACLLLVYLTFDLSWIFLAATLIIGLLYIVEHRLIKPHDLTRINVAFFQVNSLISIILLIGVAADLLLQWLPQP